MTEPTTERAQCERDECVQPGRTYYRYGKAISTGPFTYSSSAQSVPEQPITLCPDHSLEAFGFALTFMPGDPVTTPAGGDDRG